MRLKIAVIHGIARFAAGKPLLRRVLIAMLDLVPGLKPRIKRASANAVASQRLAVASGHPDEEALLSPRARRVLRDLRHERARHEQRHKSPALRT